MGVFMRNLLTGAAQPVTNTNERARKLFENRPMKVPTLIEHQDKSRKKSAKVVEEDKAQDEIVPKTHAEEEEVSEEDFAESEAPEDDGPTSGEDDAED
jgi:hypothetical protein